MAPVIVGNSNAVDVVLDQYATFALSLQITDSASVPVPLMSWSFTGSIKQHHKDVTPITTFSIAILDYTQSVVGVNLYPVQTALLFRDSYVYDIIATNIGPNPEEVYRVLEGRLLPSRGVTESEVI